MPTPPPTASDSMGSYSARFAAMDADAMAGQCRMQARENLDPEYTAFMNAVADRLDDYEACGRCNSPKASTLDADRERIARIIDERAFGDTKILRHLGATDDRPARQAAALAKADAVLALPNASNGVSEGWRDMASAPKDRTHILAIYQPPATSTEARFAGRVFSIWHEGFTASGFDMGWALYPGYGGVPDDHFAGWKPLSDLPPLTDQKAGS